MLEQSRRELVQLSIVVAAFYVCMLLLNGEALLRNAELLPYGNVRSVSVVVVRPVARVSAMGPGWLRAKVERLHDEYWKGVK